MGVEGRVLCWSTRRHCQRVYKRVWSSGYRQMHVPSSSLQRSHSKSHCRLGLQCSLAQGILCDEKAPSLPVVHVLSLNNHFACSPMAQLHLPNLNHMHHPSKPQTLTHWTSKKASMLVPKTYLSASPKRARFRLSHRAQRRPRLKWGVASQCLAAVCKASIGRWCLSAN